MIRDKITTRLVEVEIANVLSGFMFIKRCVKKTDIQFLAGQNHALLTKLFQKVLKPEQKIQQKTSSTLRKLF